LSHANEIQHASILQARDWLTQQQHVMQDELEQLCNLNSGSENVAGLKAVADHLENVFSDLGVPCERFALHDRVLLDDDARQQAIATGPALQWSSPTSADRSVLLAIHYDTVYGLGSTFQKCTMVGEDRLNGPGVIDAKGGIITLRWAIKAGLRFGLLDGVNWSIFLNPDEEVGSPCSYPIWKQLAGKFDFAMLFEPTLADGSLVDTRKGTGNFTWIVRGKSAHSGRNFAEGRNAVVHAARLADHLDRLNGKCVGVTINIGRIRGGDALNVVPDLAILRVNVRVENGEQQSWVERQVHDATAAFHQPENNLTCLLEGGMHAPPKVVDEATAHLKNHVEACGSLLGENIRWAQSGGASDGNKTAALGLPTIDTFGPEGDYLHSPNEWIRLSSMPRKAALALSVIAQFAGDPNTPLRRL
jgi:glutamate carboxypeptidase